MDFNMNGFMDPKTQALLAMSGGLLQAGAASPRPVTFGQALGQGILSGVQGYQQGIQSQRNEVMYQAQLEKLKREQKQQEALAALYGPQASQPQPAPQGDTPAGMSASTSMSLFGTPDYATPEQPQAAPQPPQARGPSLNQLGGLAATGYNVEPLLKLYDMMNPKVDWQGGVARDSRTGLPVPGVPAVPQISNGVAYDPSKLQPGQFLPQTREQDLGGSLRTLSRNPDGTERVLSETPKTGTPASLPFWLSRGPNGSQIDPVAFQGEAGLRKSGATQVNVSTEKKYGEALAGQLANADVAMRDAAIKAPDLADRANRVRQVLDSGKVITGTGADFRLALGKALNLVGASDSETVSNTEQLAGSLAQNTLDAIKASGLGSGSGFSNADRDFLEKAVGGKVTLEATTIRRLADLSYKAAQKSADRWNQRAGQIPKSAIDGTGLDVSPVRIPSMDGQSGDMPPPGAVRRITR